MRKIWIFILVMFMTLLFGQCFWYFENKVYCNIENQNVTVFLNNNESWMLKCKTYLDGVYQMAAKKYKEILAIHSYIDQWEDVYYWNNILEEKNAEFIQLVNYRTQIKKAMDKFEWILFDKYYWILEWFMRSYYSELETEYYILINEDVSLRPANYSVRVARIEQQMQNVNYILNAKTLDNIMKTIPAYFYLKDKLLWR